MAVRPEGSPATRAEFHSIFGMAQRFSATRAGIHPIFGMTLGFSRSATDGCPLAHGQVFYDFADTQALLSGIPRDLSACSPTGDGTTP